MPRIEAMFLDELKKEYGQVFLESAFGQGHEMEMVPDDGVKAAVPLDETKGDVAIPCFPFSAAMHKGPGAIASLAAERMEQFFDRNPDLAKRMFFQSVCAVGGYVNIALDCNGLASALSDEIFQKGPDAFSNASMKGERIMVEFSCPNTNKTLHLGHMRNDALGSCLSSLLKASGADVMRVNLVNDRGIHICKSMLAYKKFMDGKTPESERIKGDRLVADCYVMYNAYEKEHEKEAKEEIAEMLRKWESGDEKTRQLWKLMRKWALDGIDQTYRNTNISFDKTYYESEIYKDGKGRVLKGLEEGVFFKDDTGAIVFEADGRRKVLLRSDGTSIYITQDIGVAFKRYEDFAYDSCIYVVGNEQQDHFKTLFSVMEKLKAPFAGRMRHLSYGMVNLPDGRMKSREGVVVDADDLISDLESLSLKAMSDAIAPDRRACIAHDVALAALNYYLLSFAPGKDISFDKEKSISFSGDTGPYIQYSAARISSILANRSDQGSEPFSVFHRLSHPLERMMVLYVSSLSDVIRKSARSLDPSLLASHLHGLCKVFSRYYHDVPVLKTADDGVRKERIRLLEITQEAMRFAMRLLGIPYLSSM